MNFYVPTFDRLRTPSHVGTVRAFMSALIALAVVCLVYALHSSEAATPHKSAPVVASAIKSTPVEAVVPAVPTPAVPNTGASAPMLGITVANNGLVYLKGARVRSVSLGGMDVVLQWGSENFDWRVTTPLSVRYVGQNGELGSHASIHAGDRVAITGILDKSADTPTLVAQYIRLER